MRLSHDQIDGIISACDEFLKNRPGELRLYGSRINDQAKGGDIDLLFLMQEEKDVQELKQVKHIILTKIKNNIGDQKIDLLIASVDEAKDDNFLKMVLPQSIILETVVRREC